MSNGLNPDHLTERAESAAKDINSEMIQTHGPIWNHRIEIVKLLITLCSAILIGTISFSGSILNPTQGLVLWPFLLITSWVLIFLSLTFALICMWSHMNILSFLPRFINSGPELKSQFEKIDTKSKSLTDELLSIVNNVAIKSLQPVGSADLLSKRMLHLSMICFLLGLISFLVFGAFQFTQKPNPALNLDAAATKNSSPSIFVISRLQQTFR